MNKACYKVRGRRASGSVLWYTGRAGEAFVSDDEAQAFTYDALSVAEWRASNLNQWSALHGVHFSVDFVEARS